MSEIINEFIDKWDWKSLSKNKNLPLDAISEHRSKDWDWNALTRNPNVTWDFILELHKDGYDSWDWKYLSYAHITTSDIVLKIKDQHYFELLIRTTRKRLSLKATLILLY